MIEDFPHVEKVQLLSKFRFCIEAALPNIQGLRNRIALGKIRSVPFLMAPFFSYPGICAEEPRNRLLYRDGKISTGRKPLSPWRFRVGLRDRVMPHKR